MMKRVTAITTLVSIAIPLAGAIAETLSPTPVFEGKTTTPAKDGTIRTVHVIVQSWEIAGQDRETQEIPLRGFYVARVLSGEISTTVDGQTTQHLPGDYWTVKAGATMKVKVIGEFAVLETTVVAKQ
jgi:EutQ-like cupin domain